jgi:hypothetical protein
MDERAPYTATTISQPRMEPWHGWIGDATLAGTILERVMQRRHLAKPGTAKNGQKAEDYRPIVTAEPRI